MVTNGRFEVTTTADSGPGSLRQAILDSNSTAGGTNTIDFAIPGAGVQTIALASPLPPITASVLIDGTTQPGFAGTPLIAFSLAPPLSGAPLTVSAGNVTIRGLAIAGVAIDASAEVGLIALAGDPGVTSQLSLLDAQGHIVVQSDTASSGNPDDVIDEQLAAGDYSLSLATSNSQAASTWTILLTQSSPALQPISVGSYVDSVVAADFNGDGRADLAIPEGSYISLLISNGDGDFQPPVQVATGFSSLTNLDGVDVTPKIAVGDFTGDGHLDMAVTGLIYDSASNSYTGELSVLLGNGNGTFQPPVTYTLGAWPPTAIVAGDFSGNGHLDLAVAISSFASSLSEILMLRGNGDGTFQSPVVYAAGGLNFVITSMVTGDFRGDGNLDLAAAGLAVSFPLTSNLVVLLGNGDGTFQPTVEYPEIGSGNNFEVSSLAAADFTGDGRSDLAMAGMGGDYTGIYMLLANPDGTFQSSQLIDSTPAQSLVAGDVTGDGHLDLVATNMSGNSVTLLPGNGDGTFQPAVTYPLAMAAGALAAGDFLGNGQTDLAVGAGSEVILFLNGGNGRFQVQLPATNSVGTFPTNIVTGQFTDDGHLDLAVVNWSTGHSVGAAGQRRRHIPTAGYLRYVRGVRHRGRRLQRRRPPRPGRRGQLRNPGPPGGRRRDVPTPDHGCSRHVWYDGGQGLQRRRQGRFGRHGLLRRRCRRRPAE